MAFQTGTTASTNARRDLMVDLVAFATSKHVSAAAINAGGSGYAADDILTITHLGAWHDCKIKVLTVDGPGAILTFKILDNGAFSNRVASVAINAAGSGYVAGDIVRLTTGTYTEPCKVKVDTVSSGAAATVSIYETGGAYSVAPTATGGATDSNVGTGSGTGLLINVTAMTGLIGTTAISATGGTGSSATFDLTLTDTGWNCSQSEMTLNNYSFNSITDEKQVVLEGSNVGGNEPFVAFRTYTATVGIDTFYGVAVMGMDSYNNGLSLDSQTNLGPSGTPSNTSCQLIMLDNAQDYWFAVTSRYIFAVVKCVAGATTSYNTLGAGLLDVMATVTEMPYPLYVQGTAGNHDQAADAGGFANTGPTEAYTTAGGYSAYLRNIAGNWVGINNGGSIYTVAPISGAVVNINVVELDELAQNSQMNLHNDNNTIVSSTFATANAVIRPTLGANEILLWPATVMGCPINDTTSTTQNSGDNTSLTLMYGEIPGIYWCPATDSSGSALVAEDVIDVGGQDYILFQNAHRTERYSYFALKRA